MHAECIGAYVQYKAKEGTRSVVCPLCRNIVMAETVIIIENEEQLLKRRDNIVLIGISTLVVCTWIAGYLYLASHQR